MEPFSLCTNITTLAALTGKVWELASSFISEVSSTHASIHSITADLSAVHGILDRMKALRITDVALYEVLYGLERTLMELETLLGALKNDITKGRMRGWWVRVRWGKRGKDFESGKQALESHKLALTMGLQILTLETTQRQSQELEKIGMALGKARTVAGHEMWEERGIALESHLRSNFGPALQLTKIEAPTVVRTAVGDMQHREMREIQTYKSFTEWVETFAPSPEEKIDSVFAALDAKCLLGDLNDTGTQTVGTSDTGIRVIVVDLPQGGPDHSGFEQILTSANAPIHEILDYLREKGYPTIEGFRTNEGEALGPTISSRAPLRVTVTDLASEYDVRKGYSVNMNESLISFFNKTLSWQNSKPRIYIRHDLDNITIDDSIRTLNTTTIRLMRTLRMPENSNISSVHLPPNFGNFPIISVEDCKESVPPTVALKGGVLVPMLQREAMFLQFETGRASPNSQDQSVNDKNAYAIKLQAGAANIISQTVEMNPLNSPPQSRQGDFVVAPLQDRLDGFPLPSGKHVRQFVSMPMDIGHSIESQLAGIEYGGVQLEIAPRMTDEVQYLRLNDHALGYTSEFDILRTPQGLGLQNGDIIGMIPGCNALRMRPWDSMQRPNDKEEPQEPDRQNQQRPSYLTDFGRMESMNDNYLILYPVVRITLSIIDTVRTQRGLETFTSKLTISPFEDISQVAEHIAQYREQNSKQQLSAIEKVSCNFLCVMIMPAGISVGAKPSYKSYVGTQHSMQLHQSGYVTDGVMYSSNAKFAPTLQRTQTLLYVGESSLAIHSGHEHGGAYRPRMKRSEVPTDGWEMSLAAGRVLSQNIKKATARAVWDWDEAQVINIQLLNAVAWESVTGLAPPLSPVSFGEYQQTGLPFLSYYDVESDVVNVDELRRTDIRSLGQLNLANGINLGVRVRRDGVPVGCVLCETHLCGTILLPCCHTFCSACVVLCTAADSSIICPICSSPATDTVVFSAPCEIPSPSLLQPAKPTKDQKPTLQPYETKISRKSAESGVSLDLLLGFLVKSGQSNPETQRIATLCLVSSGTRLSDTVIDLLLALGANPHRPQPGKEWAKLFQQAFLCSKKYLLRRLIGVGCEVKLETHCAEDKGWEEALKDTIKKAEELEFPRWIQGRRKNLGMEEILLIERFVEGRLVNSKRVYMGAKSANEGGGSSDRPDGAVDSATDSGPLVE